MEPTTKTEPERENQRDRDDNKGASILQKDQHAFVDESSPAGKQFGEGRKVTDLDHVGGMTPDSDSDELPAQPPAKR
jgi:hypothetical protein